MALAWLLAELRDDPESYGYQANNHTFDITAMLNDASRERPVVVHSIDDLALLAALAAGYSELGQLDAQGWNLVNLIAQVTGRHTIDPTSTAYQAMVNGVFPVATFSTTNHALLGLAQRPGSRAEELAGAGTVVSADDVQAARAELGWV